MANLSPGLEFRVHSGIYDTKKFIDEQNYYTQKNMSIERLTSKLIYMLGKDKHSFPLAQRLMGAPYFDMEVNKENDAENPFAINTSVKTVDSEEYTYPLVVPFAAGSRIVRSSYTTGDKPGIGQTMVTVEFENNVLHKNFVIMSPKKTLAYVKDARVKGSFWEYDLVQAGSVKDNSFIDPTELAENVVWINGWSAVASSESRTTDMARAITPSLFKNQMNTLRSGLSWGGDAANLKTKVAVFSDRDPQGNLINGDYRWIDQYTLNYEVDNFTMLETLFWYSEYNRMGNGLIPLKDDLTGKVIQMGSGILQQIIHKYSYTNFTYALLSDLIGRAYNGLRDTPQTKTLYTGKLGYRKFDAAMKKAGIEFLTDWGLVADKFVTGNDRSLMLGGYFDGFYHVDGWIIKVKRVDIFDNGFITNSPIDSESGLSYESARMILLDDSMVEGESNIQLLQHSLYQPYTHAVIRGMNNVPPSIKLLEGKGNLDAGLVQEVATDMDKSSYTRKYKVGVQMLRGNTSLDLQYNPVFW